MDVFRQRLEDEYDAQVIITAPTVPYQGKVDEVAARA
jgi:translation factor GUF1, mitochondrial